MLFRACMYTWLKAFARMEVWLGEKWTATISYQLQAVTQATVKRASTLICHNKTATFALFMGPLETKKYTGDVFAWIMIL